MGEHIPRFRPGKAITRATSAAVTGGQLLAVGAGGAVAATAGATTAWLGVAAFDAASGADVLVECGGTQPLVASGAVNAGDQVVAAAAGRVAALAAATVADVASINAARQVVGVALTSAVDGAVVDVQMAR